MVDIIIVSEKLRSLETYINKLKEYRKITFEVFITSIDDQWKVERGLQLAIECILDIGNHIIADENLGNPKEYKEIIEILGNSKVINMDLAKKMEGIAGFRNILIHEYPKLDNSKIFDYLQKSPEQFEEFARDIINYIE